ncbi:MAG: ATP-binding protein [Candidatus Thiodiazotropha sp.]
MNQIVIHQLQRAAASGQQVLSGNVAVKPLVERLANTLSKVYRDKGIQWELDIDQACLFAGDEGDLMEILGNLMENACKYGQQRVRVSGQRGSGIYLSIEDDGKGIPADQMDAVFHRGHRADTRQPGQGIGLAVAADIVNAYAGQIEIAVSTRLGGAVVKVNLPGS